MIVKKFIFMMVMACAATSGVAQDKLASMAPVDKKMRTIDSLSIVRLLQHEESAQPPASALYPEWNNVYTTQYGVDMPDEYKIDLRGFCITVIAGLSTATIMEQISRFMWAIPSVLHLVARSVLLRMRERVTDVMLLSATPMVWKPSMVT